jgi:hypothetical protein
MNPAIARRIVLSAFVALAAPLVHAKPVSVAGSGANEVYDCAGDNANVSGSGNDVTLRNCDSVRVMGSGNTVRAFKPTSITVMGTNNKVTWTGSREPKISNLGVGNTVDEAERAGKEGAPDTVVKSGSGSVSVDGDGGATVKSSRPDLVLKEDGQTATHDCRGTDVVVKGDRNTYRFRECGRVVINGDDNTIDAGNVDALDVRGDGNTVSWRGAKPRVRDEGSGNTIRGR